MFELLIVANFAILASGLKVLSDEYSNPSFTILNSLTLPILLETGLIYAPVPLSDSILSKIGKLLKLNPSVMVLILDTPPDAVIEFVL